MVDTTGPAYKFTQPVNQILTMLIIAVAVAAGGYLILPQVGDIFFNSIWLNGFIALVFIFGIVTCFAQVFTLVQCVSWAEGFAEDRLGHELVRAPGLLKSVAALLSDRGARHALTSGSMRSILDSVAVRIDEGRELTRYIINLLIFLGLLGTFFGLATTVPAVVDTIRSLAPTEGQSGMEVFDNLMRGLENQLSGMGTAFGSSLLGLSGSLVIGLLDLFAGRGQNRFYRELEEWLSSITNITSGGGSSGEPVPTGVFQDAGAHMQNLGAVLTSTSDQIERLSKSMDALIAHGAQQADRTQGIVDEIARGQSQIVDAIARMQSEGEGALDAETRMRLRNMDTSLSRLLEDMTDGRAQATREMRSDLGEIAKLLKAQKKG
ncbi:MAG: biopolymer transporter ExbB [Pseudomonadota bacterium]